MFQFQYGAIKSCGATFKGVIINPFQFQYGAIKSLRLLPLWEEESCFNSNMVRLRAAGLFKSSICSGGFNSNMVRLRVGGIGGFSSVFVFQFQYGAIKRWKPVRHPKVTPCFNSNMVRLRVLFGRSFNCCQLGFNSNMVRLRDRAPVFTPFVSAVSIPIWCD